MTAATSPFQFTDSTLITVLLDEVWRLRTALAYEAAVIDAHLTLKSFPKSRRQIAEAQAQRMRDACQSSQRAYSGISSQSLRRAREQSGSNHLTRYSFEQQMIDDKLWHDGH